MRDFCGDGVGLYPNCSGDYMNMHVINGTDLNTYFIPMGTFWFGHCTVDTYLRFNQWEKLGEWYSGPYDYINRHTQTPKCLIAA